MKTANGNLIIKQNYKDTDSSVLFYFAFKFLAFWNVT